MVPLRMTENNKRVACCGTCCRFDEDEKEYLDRVIGRCLIKPNRLRAENEDSCDWFLFL